MCSCLQYLGFAAPAKCFINDYDSSLELFDMRSCLDYLGFVFVTVDGNNFASEMMKPFHACIDIFAPRTPSSMLLVVPQRSQGGAFERHQFRNWHERFSVNIELGVRGRSAEEPIRNMECAYSCFAAHRIWLRNCFRLLSDT